MQGICHSLKHLVLIALILRAFTPLGWMPDAHAGLTLCTLDGAVHQPDGHVPAQDAHHDECPFAGAPHLAAVPDVPVLAAPALHAFAAATDRSYAAVIAAHFTPQSPRAPPRNA